jgi:signal transduction histidine kinase
MCVTTKLGQKRAISWNSANRRDADGNLTEIIGIGSDITEHKQLEGALRERQQILRQMLDAYERDRRLISMEMHDGLIQQMTGAVMQMQAADIKIEHNPARAKEQLGQAVLMLRECIAEARRLMSGLRPPVLDEDGVVAAIEYLVEELRKDMAEVSFENTTTFDRLAAPLENTLFRITQESINNLRRHSQAQQAAIRLSDEDHQIHLMVRDDGVGFDQKEVSPDRFGLKGIVERAELLGGSAHITSSPGHGTSVDVFLPKIDALE